MRKNISRQRIGVQLALALLGISFYIWNKNRENLKSGNKKISRSIQTFYSSFLATSETPTTERFGISSSEDKIRNFSFLREQINENRESGYCYDYSGNLNEAVNSEKLKNDDTDSESDTDSEVESLPNQSISDMTSILNTVFLKMHVVLDLSKKTNSNPNNLAKDIHFMKSALLLLSNSQFKSHENAGVKVDAVLKAHGLERVPVAKDGNCLFASVSFSLLQLLTTDGCSLELQQHLNSIGITGDRTLPELIKLLRKLVVDEFLSCNSVEYSSFLLSAEHLSYEETAKNFEQDGFFDCELENAVNLALANVLRTSLVAFTSLENYPILTIFPKNDPVSNVPVYLAFEQIGPGHYDAVIQSGTNEELFDNTELLSETKASFAEISQPKELTRPVCRCGQGEAKNKMTRKFCLQYKSGCKCYQNLKGCTSDCGCFNCANTFCV